MSKDQLYPPNELVSLTVMNSEEFKTSLFNNMLKINLIKSKQ